MIAALRFLHLVAIAAWVGSILFFSFVGAPTIFAVLPRDLAGRAVSAIFPRYYLLGLIAGAVALASALILGALSGRRDPAFAASLVLLVVMLGLTAYADRVVRPRAAALRQALPRLEGKPEQAEARARFDALHRQSVALNGAVLLLGLGVIAVTAARGGPP